MTHFGNQLSTRDVAADRDYNFDADCFELPQPECFQSLENNSLELKAALLTSGKNGLPPPSPFCRGRNAAACSSSRHLAGICAVSDREASETSAGFDVRRVLRDARLAAGQQLIAQEPGQWQCTPEQRKQRAAEVACLIRP